MNGIPGTVRLWCSLLCLIILVALNAFSQSTSPERTGKRRMADERSVINLLELAERDRLSPPPEPAFRVRIHKSIPAAVIPSNAVIKPEDPSVTFHTAQASASPRPLSPATAVNFLALEDAGNAIPPDTNGAVGRNHLMVTLNTQVRVSDRNGNTITTVSLNSFWSSLGVSGVFDPKVLYDPFADRWIFSAVSGAESASSAVLIAVSQTSDPTGFWNLFKADADADDIDWADYPSMGFNKDWIVVTINMFGIASGSFTRSELYVYDKAALYAGDAESVNTFSDDGFTWAPAVTHDNALATMHLIQNVIGNFNGNGFIRMATITGSLGSEIFTPGEFVSTPAPWSDVGPPNFAPQLGDPRGIDSGDSRMLKVVFRNGALWCSHTVLLPADTPNRAAVQWWKLEPDGDVLQRGRIDDATATFFRAYPVLAVNKHGDVLIGYSIFSEGMFASAAYSFRAFSDPPNTLQAEAELRLGEARYFKDFGFGSNRWGDYSNTVVDPVNDVDMWTIQEFAALPNISDRWGTWWGKLELPDPDFALLISNPALTVFPDVTATFNGTLTAIDGYNNSVAITCQPNHTGVPGTCNGTTATPSAGGQAFSVSASSAVVQDFAFNIQGVGSDAGSTTRVQAVTLNVVNFALTDPAPNAVTIVKGNTSSAMVFQVQALGSFAGAVTLECDGLPAGANCHFSPSNLVTPTLGSPATVSLTVSTEVTTPDFDDPITITATSSAPVGERTESFNLTVTSPASGADVSVDVSHSFTGARINFGMSATFAVLVANAGPETASNIVVSVVFAGARPKTLAAGCSPVGGSTIVCPIASLAQGANSNLVFSFEAAVGGIRVTATAAATSADPVTTNNADTAFLQASPRPRTIRGTN